jgi:hypothetical protein
MWSTGPYLQNNTIGRFNPSPSVEARMRVFQDSIEKLLWPERREKDPIFANDSGAGVGIIDRTTDPSWIWVPRGYIPDHLRGLLGIGQRLFPFLVQNGSIRIGPIPKGFPVSLIASLNLMAPEGADLQQRSEHRKRVLRVLKQVKRELKEGQDIFADRQTIDDMVALSNCPDYVVNKGHYFGTNLLPEEPGLSDADKRALIGFLKTF